MDLESFKSLEKSAQKWHIEGFELISRNLESTMAEEFTITEDWDAISSFLDSLLLPGTTCDHCLLELYEKISEICNNQQEQPLHHLLTTYYLQYFEAQLSQISNLTPALPPPVGQQNPTVFISDLWQRIKTSSLQASQIFKFFERSYLLTTPTPTYSQ